MTEEQKKAHNAAMDAGECPISTDAYGERLYCDRGIKHDRHGPRGSMVHEAGDPYGGSIAWYGFTAERRRLA